VDQPRPDFVVRVIPAEHKHVLIDTTGAKEKIVATALHVTGEDIDYWRVTSPQWKHGEVIVQLPEAHVHHVIYRVLHSVGDYLRAKKH
jgi:hypothetical protein